jgi:hypothetical protein
MRRIERQTLAEFISASAAPLIDIPSYRHKGGHMRKSLLITSALLLGAAAPAFGADNGFYLGASVGRTNVEIDDISGLSAADFDADDTGFKFIAGIRPLDWLAVEASYVNFGEPEDTVMGAKVKTEGDGISAFAVGFLAVGPVDLFGKVGLVTWDTKVATFDDDGTDFAYGVGAQFRLLSLAVRAEYEKFDLSGVDDLSMISIGVTYTFL